MGGRISRSRQSPATPRRTEKLAHQPVPAHRHSVTCIEVFGADGELVVTASEDRTMCLWDLSARGKYKRHWQMRKLSGHGLQMHADFESSSDAPSHRRPVDSLQESAMVRCPQPKFTQEGHGHWVTCVCADEDSSLVYSGSMDKTVKTWDMYTARCMRTYHAGGDWISGLHVRRDVLWASSEDGYLRVWKAHPHLPPEAADADIAIGEIEGSGKAVKKMLALDRDCLLTGDAGGTVCYWHLKGGMSRDSALQATAHTKVGIITCMALPYHEQQVQLWNRPRRPLLQTPATRALSRPSSHLQPLVAQHTAAAAGAGAVVMTALIGGHLGVEMWELAPPMSSGGGARGSQLSRRFGGHSGAISCLTIVDGTLFTGSDDATIRAWALDTGACLQIFQGHLSGVRCVRVLSYAQLALLRHEQHLAAAADEHDDSAPPPSARSDRDRAAAASTRGGVLCSGANDLRIWDIDSGEVLHVLARRRVDAIAVARRGALLLSATDGLVACACSLPLKPSLSPGFMGGSSVLRPSVMVASMDPLRSFELGNHGSGRPAAKAQRGGPGGALANGGMLHEAGAVAGNGALVKPLDLNHGV